MLPLTIWTLFLSVSKIMSDPLDKFHLNLWEKVIGRVSASD